MPGAQQKQTEKGMINEILPALSCAGEASQLLDCACQGNYLLLWCLINTPVLHSHFHDNPFLYSPRVTPQTIYLFVSFKGQSKLNSFHFGRVGVNRI